MGLDASDQEITLLKKISSVEPQSETDFINITVKFDPQAEAVELANAIAQIGIERARSIHESRAKRALEALDEELDAQSEMIADHRKDLAVILDTFGLEFPPENQPFPSSSSVPVSNDIDELGRSQVQNSYSQARDSYTQSRAMLREIKIKQEEARTLLDQPHHPITIHQLAE